MKCTKVTLICLTDEVYSIGPRRISSQLKRNAFEVQLIFLQAKSFWGQIKERFSSHYDESDLSETTYRELIALCADSMVVGLSVWTHNADRAALITRRLQQSFHCPIIWGGIHPTCFPEQALETAEGICLGEGDISFLRLAEALRDGRDYRTTPGFWFRDGTGIIRNPAQPLVQDLDELPFMDFEYEDHFVNEGGTLRQMNLRLMKKYYGAKLEMMLSHGCPYKCTFCSNDQLIELDQGYRKFRKHSVDFFLAELRYILARYPHIYNLIIDDDAFMFLPLKLIQEFAARYKKEFPNLPFFVSGIIPASITKEKFQVLMDAGMIKTRVGIQSGNRRIMREVFVRPLHEEKLVEGSEIAHQNWKRLAPIQYDLIVDNPWEHPDELKDTVRLLHRLKRPYTFALNSLRLLPGTTIFRMGEQAGFTGPDQNIMPASYEQFIPNMLNLTLAFYNITRAPEFWIRYILKRDFGQRTVTMKRYPRIGFLISFAGMLKKSCHNLIRGDISLWPRPLDQWCGRLFVGRTASPSSSPTSISSAYKHALPRRNQENARVVTSAIAQEHAAVGGSALQV